MENSSLKGTNLSLYWVTEVTYLHFLPYVYVQTQRISLLPLYLVVKLPVYMVRYFLFLNWWNYLISYSFILMFLFIFCCTSRSFFLLSWSIRKSYYIHHTVTNVQKDENAILIEKCLVSHGKLACKEKARIMENL